MRIRKWSELAPQEQAFLKLQGKRLARGVVLRVVLALLGMPAGAEFLEHAHGVDPGHLADAAQGTGTPHFGANGQDGRFQTDYTLNGHSLVSDADGTMHLPGSDQPVGKYDAGVQKAA